MGQPQGIAPTNLKIPTMGQPQGIAPTNRSFTFCSQFAIFFIAYIL